MALHKHETMAVTATATATVHSPSTTTAALWGYGSDLILMSTTDSIRFTVDGQTTPVVGAGAEVGTLLRSTDIGFVLTPEEFVNLKVKYVTAACRVQFEFLSGDRRRIS